MKDDFYKKGFDEGTKVKLELLRIYIQSWLPVFVDAKNIYWKKIYIYDFFAGEGMDGEGKFGSPLMVLNELVKKCQTITEKGISVKIVLNEKKKSKIKLLTRRINEFIIACRKKSRFKCCVNCIDSNKCPFEIEYSNEDFKTFFNSIYPSMIRKSELPRFMFIDQFGIKQVSADIFEKLTSLKRTDFMFFISSSFLRRFADLPDFKSYFGLNKHEFQKVRPEHSHRIVLDYYKNLLLNSKRYYLSSFSIKKGANIYGLIFGSNNPLGMEKFLNAAWRIDKNTGEANFNIDKDRIITTKQLSFFEEDNKIQKVDLFERNFTEWLKENERTNEEVYLFTLENGMTTKHAVKILKQLDSRNILKINSTDSIKEGSYYIRYSSNKKLKFEINE